MRHTLTPTRFARSIAAAAALTLTLGFGVASSHAAPLLHWTFDESTGTTAADSVPTAGPDGGDNAGTLENFPNPTDPRWVTGKAGNALQFDGSDDRVIDDFSSTVTFNNYTLSLWAQTSAPNQGNGFDSLFSTRPGGGGSLETFQIEVDSNEYKFNTISTGQSSPSARPR